MKSRPEKTSPCTLYPCPLLQPATVLVCDNRVLSFWFSCEMSKIVKPTYIAKINKTRHAIRFVSLEKRHGGPKNGSLAERAWTRTPFCPLAMVLCKLLRRHFFARCQTIRSRSNMLFSSVWQDARNQHVAVNGRVRVFIEDPLSRFHVVYLYCILPCGYSPNLVADYHPRTCQSF